MPGRGCKRQPACYSTPLMQRKRKMSDIFISYSRTDLSKAKAIAELLDQHDWSIWWDRRIPAGRIFDDVIEEALDAARCVIVVWSKESVASRWVRMLQHYAHIRTEAKRTALEAIAAKSKQESVQQQQIVKAVS